MATKLSKLRAQKSELDSKIKLLESKEVMQAKKADTRHKILAGAYILHQMEKNNSYANFLEQLDSFLFRPADRKLFGLEPRT